jgi:hypothetical protein
MSSVISASPTSVDFAAVKTRQQAAWSTGNYAGLRESSRRDCRARSQGSRSCSATSRGISARWFGSSPSAIASPTHWIEVFRTYYGPMNKTFAALDAGKEADFTQDLLALMESRNRSGDSTLVLPSEYLEVVIDRK